MRDYYIKLNGEEYSHKKLQNTIQRKLSEDNLKNWQSKYWGLLSKWIDGDLSAIEISTSGSTGTPKTIAHSKQNMLNSARMTCDFFGLNEQSTALCPISTEYIGGMMMIVRAIHSGMDLYLQEPSSSPTIERPFSFSAMVPMQLFNLLGNEDKKDSLNHIEKVIIGGGEVSPELEEKLQGLDTKVYSTYGMTETISHIALRPLNGPKRSPYFTTLNGINVSLDERACLVINAPMLTDKEIVTNDFCEPQNETTFRWLGRYDNIINSGGIKLIPEQIEAKLKGLIPYPFAISSIPDEQFGNKLVLVIESDNIGEEVYSIQESLLESLKGPEKPKEVHTLASFPRTETGKLKRKELSKLLIEQSRWSQ